MDESLDVFLSRMNLSQYLQNFREAGYEELETVVTLSEEELERDVGIVLPGHKRKLSLNFEKLCQPTKEATSQSTRAPEKEKPKGQKIKNQSKLTFQGGMLVSVNLPPEPLDPEVPWKRFLIPHPRFPRQTFFNEIIPKVYESAQPHLLTRFESFWIKERRERWERKELLENLNTSVTRITDISDKNYIVRVRSVPNPSRPQDVTTCASAVKEVDSKLKQLDDIHIKLQQQKLELFEPSSTTLKPWATEQFEYAKETLTATFELKSQLETVKQEVEETHKELAERYKFSMASTEKSRKRKRHRDNAQKSQKRKIKGQKMRMQDLLKQLCSNEEVLANIADMDDDGNIKLKRPLEAEEANLAALGTLQPRSHYNSLLSLRNNDFFASSLTAQINIVLQTMLDKIKTFKGFEEHIDSDSESEESE